MNKAELVAVLAESAGLSTAAAGRAIDAMFDKIINTLQQGDTVTIAGFGTFKVSHRKARKGVNPRTKEPIDIPASKNVAFKAGKAFKDALN